MPSLKQSTSEASSRLHKIEQLFLEHLPAYRTYPLLRWLEWADACGFLFSVFPDEREETVLAAAIVRPITLEQLEQKYDGFVFDRDGDILFFDLVVAPSRELTRALGYAVLNRFGRRAGVALHIDGKLKVHDHSTATKALFKLKN